MRFNGQYGGMLMFFAVGITGEEVDFTEKYKPGAGNVLGQAGNKICLGSGDFSLFVNPNDDFMYIFYNKIYIDIVTTAKS